MPRYRYLLLFSSSDRAVLRLVTANSKTSSLLSSIGAIMSFPVDKVLGTLLLGTYGNSILYTLEVVAVIKYYSATKRDPHLLQAVVYFTFLVDTISTLVNYACVYFYTITHWGDPNFFSLGFWPSVGSLATICTSETIVQFFLIFRYWRMSKNKYITSVLILFVLAGLGGSIASIYLYSTTNYTERDKLVTSDIIWFSTSAATDIAVAIALLWQLNRIKSPFKSTRSLVHRLMVATIRTGTVTSVFAVVIVILVVTDTTSNAPMTVGFCLGRIYALTMLYNLNNRGSRNDGSTNTNGTSGELGSNSVTKLSHVHMGVLSPISSDQCVPDHPDHWKA